MQVTGLTATVQQGFAALVSAERQVVGAFKIGRSHLAPAPSVPRFRSVLSQDRHERGRWAALLQGPVGRLPLPTPEPYYPQSPLIYIAPWIGTAILGQPLVTDYTAIPTATFTGRPLTSAAGSVWREAARPSAPLTARWSRLEVIFGGPGGGAGDSSPGEDDSYPRTVIVTRHWYMIRHALHCVRLPDRTPLPWRSATLRTDASQWGWTLSLELLGRDAAALVQPSGSDPVRIEFGINGATWVCLAEDWSESSKHGNWTVTSVTGRGLSALLSGRYIRPRSYTETAAQTVAQLADQEAGLGAGWTVTWTAADWLVPAGAWSYQGLAPIQAIARLAAAAGGLVYAAPDEQVLSVRPWYRLLPWVWAPGQEDLLVPEAALLGLNRRYRYPDQANAVHVYGGEVGGVQRHVYREGSAGDEFAAEVSEPLITHVDGARALGERTLAAQARPAGVVSFTMAVDPRADYPVPELGDLVRVQVDGGQMGPVTSIQIDVTPEGDGTRVRQTIGLSETVNDYQRLIALMPSEPRTLAQVAAAHGDGTLTVDTLSGGSLRVRGTASVGAWVWVRAGRVEGAAPTLPGGTVAV